MSLLHCRSLVQWIRPGISISVRYNNGSYFNNRFHKTRLYPELIKKWRRRKGLPENPTAYGHLTDLPDYTFLDGRRTLPTLGQIRRTVKQRDLAEKIIQLTAEVDDAVERDTRAKREAIEEKEDILKQKLRPKSRPFGATQSEAVNPR